MRRKVIAIIDVDDDIAFEKIHDGVIPYLEHEFGWLEQSGINLRECFISDDDENDRWQAYLNYIVKWAFDHQGDELVNKSPDCYEKFCNTNFV